MSLNEEYSIKEINIILCKNIITMLTNRKLIVDGDKIYDEIEKDINIKPFIEFTLLDDSKCNIYIINVKITSIVKGTPLDDFLINNIDIHKIIIIKDFTNKVIKQINDDYLNAEVFFEHEMIEDITKKKFIPVHQLLTQVEKNELFTRFNENELSIILSSDPMSRYYNAKLGDVFKIIRPSSTSGYSPFYRRIVANQWII